MLLVTHNLAEAASVADSIVVMRSGALPAAALALLVDGMLAVAERLMAPAHLRHAARS